MLVVYNVYQMLPRATNVDRYDLYKISPENDHGRFLTKILAKFKKVSKVYLINDHFRPLVQNFA